MKAKPWCESWSLSSAPGALCCPFPLCSSLCWNVLPMQGKFPRVLCFHILILNSSLQRTSTHTAHGLLNCCGDQQGLCNNSGALWHLLFTQSSSLLLLSHKSNPERQSWQIIGYHVLKNYLPSWQMSVWPVDFTPWELGSLIFYCTVNLNTLSRQHQENKGEIYDCFSLLSSDLSNAASWIVVAR